MAVADAGPGAEGQFAHWVAAFLAGVRPEELQVWAEEGRDMSRALASMIPGASLLGPQAVRALMGRQAVEEARHLDERGFDRLLDRLLEIVPDQAVVLWAKRPWYLREMQRLRDLICGT